VSGYQRFLRADRIVVGGSYLLPLFPGAVNLPPLSPHLNRQRRLEAARPFVATPGRRILYLGAMEAVRGVHTLVEALALLRHRPTGGDYSLTLAWNGHGSPQYRQRIEAEVTRLGLAGSVRWLGVVNDLARLYRQHDVVVIPHTSKERMGFPLRLLEALSYGRPVVVSDTGEMPLVAAGSGVVFPRRDADGLARSLHTLLEDPDVYQRCVRHAYATVARYEPADTVRCLLDLYEGLAAGPR
jgi:glycosyltransferase involved in cell wall biosynthesis